MALHGLAWHGVEVMVMKGLGCILLSWGLPYAQELCITRNNRFSYTMCPFG